MSHWSHCDPLIARTPTEDHTILKTHRIFMFLIYFMGNYVAFKNYTNLREKPIFINCKSLCPFRNRVSTEFFFYCVQCHQCEWLSMCSSCILHSSLVLRHPWCPRFSKLFTSKDYLCVRQHAKLLPLPSCWNRPSARNTQWNCCHPLENNVSTIANC